MILSKFDVFEPKSKISKFEFGKFYPQNFHFLCTSTFGYNCWNGAVLLDEKKATTAFIMSG